MNLKKIKGQYQKKKEEGNRKKKVELKTVHNLTFPSFVV